MKLLETQEGLLDLFLDQAQPLDVQEDKAVLYLYFLVLQASLWIPLEKLQMEPLELSLKNFLLSEFFGIS